MANAKAVQISGNTVTFLMDLRKDAPVIRKLHPTENLVWRISVTVDVTGVNRESMLTNNFSGSSMRVKLQAKLRKKTDTELDKLVEVGYKTTWSEIGAAEVLSTGDLMARLSKDQFIEIMTEEYDLSVEAAEKMYNIKHGIPVTAPEN